MANKFRPGQNKLKCMRTGFTIYSGDAKREWNGTIVRSQSYEERHPQDFVRGVKDDQKPDISNPEPEWRFLSDNEVTPDDL